MIGAFVLGFVVGVGCALALMAWLLDLGPGT